MNRSGIVSPKQPKWHGRAGAWLIYAALGALGKTWKIRITGPSAALFDSVTQPAIFALWHNRLAIVVPFWAHVRRHQPELKLAALVSASRDGGLLSQTLAHVGIVAVRGSSSRRGPQALREAVTLMGRGHCVAITPDGPRGPKYQVQPGILALAQLTGTAIVPIGVNFARKKALRSWDAFQIPMPFTACEFILGAPILVSREAEGPEREAKRAELESVLRGINRD